MPRRQRPRTERSASYVAFGLTALLAGGAVLGPRAWSTLTDDSEPELAAYELDGIDLTQVHRELLPKWVALRSGAQGEQTESEAFAALERELESNPALLALAKELRDKTTPSALADAQNREAVAQLFVRWNEVLDAADIPLMIRGGADLRPLPFFYAVTGEVSFDSHVRVSGEPQRVRILRRLDRLPLHESRAGVVDRRNEGAILMQEQIVLFALDELWPMFANEELVEASGPWRTAFAAGVRAEVEAALSPEYVESLRRTADARASMMNAVRAIRSRSSCSHFVVLPVPWDGMTGEVLGVLRRHISTDPGCPAVTAEEHRQLVRAARELEADSDLKEAVEALVAFVVPPIMMHEARHAADFEQAEAGSPRRCRSCDDLLDEPAQIEFSAYLAELAHTDRPATALAQACLALQTSPSAHHRRAMSLVLGRANHRCEDGPVPNASTIFRELEAEAFGRVDEIALVEPPPERLSVVSLQFRETE